MLHHALSRVRLFVPSLVVLACLTGSSVAAQEPSEDTPAPPPTTAEVLASAAASDWRPLDPGNTLYVTLPGGRVVIELAPELAPRHVANVKQLVAQRYFDGLAVVRSQENYVVQWGDPKAGEEGARGFGEAQRSLPPEWERGYPKMPKTPKTPEADDGPSWTPLGDPDVYAPEVGFVRGLPAARNPETGRMWLAHCPAMVGAGRANEADSGSGAELYVVIGHAPRHLDRNVTLLGRVVQGMEVLSTLPRGTGGLGFYETPEEQVPIVSIRLGSELPADERANLELLRTDTATFEKLIESRRFRNEEWFLDSVGAVELCNVPLPVREVTADAQDG